MQRLEHACGRRTEIEQGGDLIHADRLEALHERQTRLRRADQAARGRESLIQKIDEFGAVIGCECREVHLLSPALRESLQQADVVIDVRAERRARLFTDRRFVVTDKGMDHHAHLPRRRIESGRRTRRSIAHDLRGEGVHVLIEQVREQVRARRAGAFERIRIRRRRDPHRAFRLHRTRQRTDAHLLSEPVRTDERFAAPEGAHGVERAIQVRLPIDVVRRRKREVVRVPPRGQRDARPAVRQRVDDRPVLDEAHRMMQWGDDTAGLQAHVLRAHGQGRVQHRR